MKTYASRAAAVLAALLVCACGGGGDDPPVPGTGSPSGAPTTKGSFTALVSFGDSLSDIGTYAPATSLTGNGAAPYFGGKFTTNGPDGTVWVENLAAALSIVVTPAEVGFATTSVQCPVALSVPSLASTCTAYGQGGARVTDPNGIGHDSGALTVPIVTQIARHLERFGSFKDSDLVIVYAGNNDVLAQFRAFAATATQVQADAAAGLLTPDQANAALFAAQSAAQAAVKQAAIELTVDIKTQILAKGGKYVAVMTLSDIANTPLGKSLPAAVQPVLTSLSQLFNLWLRDGLTGAAVRIIETPPIFLDAYVNPAKYGVTNVTTPACSAAKISAITGGRVTDGSSLFCNDTPGAPYNGVVDAADVATYEFADSIHPTAKGHRLLTDAFTAALTGFGWL